MKKPIESFLDWLEDDNYSYDDEDEDDVLVIMQTLAEAFVFKVMQCIRCGGHLDMISYRESPRRQYICAHMNS